MRLTGAEAANIIRAKLGKQNQISGERVKAHFLRKTRRITLAWIDFSPWITGFIC